MKLLTVVGARPQFIKAAVVSRAIAGANEARQGLPTLEEVIVHTGQHYDDDMSEVFFRDLEVPRPAYNLGVGSGSHGRQTGRMLEAIEPVIERERPDCLLVYGDTNSTLAGALAASKVRVPVAHVEAGLRSFNRDMPEEINRVVVDHLATHLFCPTEGAVKNLSCEGIVQGVHRVGDVMYDSLLYNLERAKSRADILSRLGLQPGSYALATIHRAETTRDATELRRLVSCLGAVGLPVIVPLHPRTKRALDLDDARLNLGEVRLIPPVSYHEMLTLEQHARLVVTDSGGVQKEAFLLRVPCVTLRNETEWWETVEAGWNRLAGTEPAAVAKEITASLDQTPSTPGSPYGVGRAGEAIVEVLLKESGSGRVRPEHGSEGTRKTRTQPVLP